MANEILLKTGTPQISFADHATDFAPAAANSLEQGTPTDVELDLASVANNAARQSAKFDLGATRSARYNIIAALEFASSGLTNGTIVEFWIGWSPDATAANGNPGGLSGSDAAYAGYSSNLDASVKHLDRVGTMIVTVQATGTVQISQCGMFVPRERYGILVVLQRSGASMHSDDVETHIVFDPITDESQ